MYNIIGRGTAGIITAALLLLNDNKIRWYYNSKIKPVRVGEGTLTDIPQLFTALGFSTEELIEINATFKMGLFKSGWSKNDFYDEFKLGHPGIHMSAVDLQENFFSKLASHPNVVEVVDEDVCVTDFNSDYTIDCSGTPKVFDNSFVETNIPVNNAYVTQCNWGKKRMEFSLTIARPYGWVFGIPLQNRVSIGYLFNENFNNLEDIKEDVKYIFERFDLYPTKETNHIKFNNYYRKENFNNNYCFSGNKSFFLEPLEATSLSCSLEIAGILLQEDLSPLVKNSHYKNLLKQAENVIMLHYLSTNNFKTDFWKYARDKALTHFDGKDLYYIKNNCLFFDKHKVEKHIRELEINIV